MKWLQYLCLFLGITYIFSAITGIQAISMSSIHGTNIAYLSIYGRIYSFAAAGILVLFAFGLHKRALITWKAGFVLWGLGYIDFVMGGVTSMIDVAPVKDFPSFWLPVIFVVIGGSTVGVWGGYWWNRQRSHFF
jgi:hypothetical protein